jgi:hypothetical protein
VAIVEPMSDRRTIVLVLAILTALVGVAITVLAAISLQEPSTVSGELGTRIEVSGELIAATVLGVLLVISGTGIAAGLVRAQLHGARR